MSMIQGDGFDVELIRSKRRKTLALSIRNGRVCVRIPARLAQHHAERFVAEKTAWIKQKLAAFPPLPERQWQNGEAVRFQGQVLKLHIACGEPRNHVQQHEDRLHVHCYNASPGISVIQRLVRNWYRAEAERHLLARSQKLAEQTGLTPTAVEVKTYRARWGSCRRDGQIQLNWKLIMAPPEVIDYVIIHELCHLRQHNHSPAFWQLVARFKPDYLHQRDWLRQNGYQLEL